MRATTTRLRGFPVPSQFPLRPFRYLGLGSRPQQLTSLLACRLQTSHLRCSKTILSAHYSTFMTLGEDPTTVPQKQPPSPWQRFP